MYGAGLSLLEKLDKRILGICLFSTACGLTLFKPSLEKFSYCFIG